MNNNNDCNKKENGNSKRDQEEEKKNPIPVPVDSSTSVSEKTTPAKDPRLDFRDEEADAVQPPGHIFCRRMLQPSNHMAIADLRAASVQVQTAADAASTEEFCRMICDLSFAYGGKRENDERLFDVLKGLL